MLTLWYKLTMLHLRWKTDLHWRDDRLKISIFFPYCASYKLVKTTILKMCSSSVGISPAEISSGFRMSIANVLHSECIPVFFQSTWIYISKCIYIYIYVSKWFKHIEGQLMFFFLCLTTAFFFSITE